MSIFEFISVSVAIVLALTLGRLMTAVQDVFDTQRRDYLHIGFYLASYVAVLTTWWAQWMLTDSERWNFFAFMLAMASPISLYFVVHGLLTSNPSTVGDWRSHFRRNSRWIFGALLVTTVAITARRVFLAEEALQELPVFLAADALVFGLAIVFKARALHALALAMWVASLGYAISLQFEIVPQLDR